MPALIFLILGGAVGYLVGKDRCPVPPPSIRARMLPGKPQLPPDMVLMSTIDKAIMTGTPRDLKVAAIMAKERGQVKTAAELAKKANESALATAQRAVQVEKMAKQTNNPTDWETLAVLYDALGEDRKAQLARKIASNARSIGNYQPSMLEQAADVIKAPGRMLSQ